MNHKKRKAKQIRRDRDRLPRKWRWFVAPLAALLVEVQGLPFIIEFAKHPNPMNGFQVFFGAMLAVAAAFMIARYG